MSRLDLVRQLSVATESKIVLLVIDGLGGLPHPGTGKTELETALTPNMDALAASGSTGLLDPVAPGITPGSGPGHLALFGYDPVACLIGRGVLEALGIDLELEPGDVAARGNFATIDASGRLTDRRAGRISTELAAPLCRALDGMAIEDVKVIVRPVKDHRFVAVFRGPGLSEQVTDSDPEATGVAPRTVQPLDPAAARMADIANRWLEQAGKLLAGHQPANMVLLRGFSEKPQLASMNEIYKLVPAAIASYPMYRGLARVVGMDVLPTGPGLAEEMNTLKANYDRYTFFFVHVKGADAAGEDGDFPRKVAVIEEVDRALPAIMALEPAVLAVTGDHSTPASLGAHSWHPVPLLVHSAWCRHGDAGHFSETACVQGALGRMAACQLMTLLMAHALKLTKFGA